MKVDPNTQQSRGFGFVLFEDEHSIDEVAKVPNHSLDGKKIDPKKAERRDGKMFVGGVKGDTTDETIHVILLFIHVGNLLCFRRNISRAMALLSLWIAQLINLPEKTSHSVL